MNLIDGPCMGNYLTKRAPVFLRAVMDELGEKDVLDRLDDKPTSTEKVYVYRLEGESGTIHLYGRGKVTGWYAMGTYRHMPEVDGEKMRDTATWRAWCEDKMREKGG